MTCLSAKRWLGAFWLFMVFALAGCQGGKPEVATSDTRVPGPVPSGRVLYWKSQMVPGYRSDRPGNDPMGMPLVPVYQQEAAAGPPGSIAVNPQTTQSIGVKTVTIRREALRRDLRTVGRVDYDEELVRDVAPKIGGWVEKQYVNYPGQLVRRGQALGEIYSPDLVATEEEYLNTLHYAGALKESPLEDATSQAQSLVGAVETRLRYWDISEAQIKALRERGRITRTMVLHAPFTGVVVKKNVFEGGYVNPGEAMYRLADISRVWVYADIYEYEAAWLRPGQEATMTLSYEPGSVYRGRVLYIYPYLKEMTRTLQVRMEFRNGTRLQLKPGMWANVNLKPPVARDALVVPLEAVIQTGKKNYIIVALGNGRFAPREISLGVQAGDSFEVLAGLREGERVVTSAEFLLDSESALQSAFNKMTPQHGEEGRGSEAHEPAGGLPSQPRMEMRQPDATRMEMPKAKPSVGPQRTHRD